MRQTIPAEVVTVGEDFTKVKDSEGQIHYFLKNNHNQVRLDLQIVGQKGYINWVQGPSAMYPIFNDDVIKKNGHAIMNKKPEQTSIIKEARIKLKEQKEAERQAAKTENQTQKKFDSIMLSVTLSCERMAEMKLPRLNATQRIQAARSLAKSSELIAQMKQKLLTIKGKASNDK